VKDSNRNGSARRILIVDDEADMLEVFVEILERGLKETILEGGTDPRWAARRLDESRFDLLITNVQMPRLSGLELLRIARRLAPAMPVVVVTGYPMRETAEMARALGASHYVTKPFVPAELLETIRSAVGSTGVY
jgi:CheY-like chemotaxis protein